MAALVVLLLGLACITAAVTGLVGIWWGLLALGVLLTAGAVLDHVGQALASTRRTGVGS